MMKGCAVPTIYFLLVTFYVPKIISFTNAFAVVPNPAGMPLRTSRSTNNNEESEYLPKESAYDFKELNLGRNSAFVSPNYRRTLRSYFRFSESTSGKIRARKSLSSWERKEIRKAEHAKYIELRQSGIDEVSNTAESMALRNYKLRNKKRKGIIFKKEASLADVLFPGDVAIGHVAGEPIAVYATLVESRKRPVPLKFGALPVCPTPMESEFRKDHRERKNLGTRLQGHDFQVAPYEFHVKTNSGCTVLCSTSMNAKTLKWMRRLIISQYRVQLQLDQMPVLMRNKEYNVATRGYPIGFIAPEHFQSLRTGGYYLFNHMRFIVTYSEDDSFEGVHITGFDVHPISIKHDTSTNITKGGRSSTCNGEVVDNDPSRYLNMEPTGSQMGVVYSYEVEWIASGLSWSDRWDVYLIGTLDNDLHYLSVVNSLMIVLILAGIVSQIVIRNFRKVIGKDIVVPEGAEDETGWFSIQGDVFRTPQTQPMLLCVLVGAGFQICMAFGLTMVFGLFGLFNPLRKGQTLTSMIVLFCFCGPVAGFVSSWIYEAISGQNRKLNTVFTAVLVPGSLMTVYFLLSARLVFCTGSAMEVTPTVLVLSFWWLCILVPLVILGSIVGRKVNVKFPTETSEQVREIPSTPWYVQLQWTAMIGGVLPFGVVFFELQMILGTLWLHRWYYQLDVLLVTFICLVLTCAGVSAILVYLQLCFEDYRWWWRSFWNCASAGVYMFLFSLYYLATVLDFVGATSVLVYVTYMGMMSVCFGLVCGSVGFLSAFWFTRMMYGTIKLE